MSIAEAKFQEAMQLGPSSTVVSYLLQGEVRDGYKLTLAFDDDPRFFRVDGVHIDKPEHPKHGRFTQLFPLTSVASIFVKNDGKPVQPTKAEAKK